MVVTVEQSCQSNTHWSSNGNIYIYIVIWLVVSTPLKNISQLGLLFPIYGKIKMFQTTNQVIVVVITKTLEGTS